MPLLTLEQAQAHLRVDPGEEDALISLYLEAAEQAAVDFLNRVVFVDQASLAAAVADESAGKAPVVVNAAIRAAILLTLGHLYANREDVVQGVTAEAMPLGARSLLRPHRLFPGF